MGKITLGLLQITSKASVLPDDVGIIPILWERRLKLILGKELEKVTYECVAGLGLSLTDIGCQNPFLPLAG